MLRQTLALLLAHSACLMPAVAQEVRQVAPDIVAPPAVDPGDLTRDVPRGPLSEIGPAGPAKPKPRKAGMVFGSVATAAGVVETGALTVTVAGIDVVHADETCSDGGPNWPCGMQARTAFRGFVRGRALDCDLPPEMTEGAATASCRVGGRDVGGWLVANGWARAAVDGPYSEAGETAEEEGRGIFGPAPDLSSAPPAPPPFQASAELLTILEEAGPEADAAATPPASPPAPAR